MSSITDRRFGRRGQVLPIFAFGIVGILAIAALVFDVGRDLLERRAQQNAVDASALAGARYLTTTSDAISGLDCKALSTVAACAQAVQAARDLAARHGYVDGTNGVSVRVNIPPNAESKFNGAPGHIQVIIDDTFPSIFSGLLGINSHRIAALAVAGNNAGYSLPYGMIALNPHACGAGQIGGTGVIDINASVMVASDCQANPGSGSFQFDGSNATITADQCSTSGDSKLNGNPSNIDCNGSDAGTGTIVDDFTPQVTDPLAFLSAPTIGSASVPNPPTDMVVTGAHAGTNKAPNGCPGGTTTSTAASPSGCVIQYNRVKEVVIYPGVYWGGLKIKEASHDLTVYMMPGIYYMAGGGFEVSGQVRLQSIESFTNVAGLILPSVDTGGVLIYNGEGPNCSTIAGQCIGDIDFQGTTGGNSSIALYPYDGPTYTNMLMFQARSASSQPTVKISGNSTMALHGTIYLPKADFEYTGNGVGEILNAQVICDEFKVTGGGSLQVDYDPNEAVKVRGVGLVQ